MTKKEALINRIQDYLDSGLYKYEGFYRRKEDLETIIEALKAESCDDCISRKATIHALGEVHPLDYNAQAIKTRIEQLPSVQPTRPKGKWIDDCGKFYCSECKAEYDEIYETHSHTYYSKFCPNCGADMREGEINGTLD